MAEREAIRINLGSGDRCLDGWANVDLHAECANVRQDLRKVAFPENYAERIICIHAIEHIEREWGLVLIERCATWLKKGGTLEIETPCAQKCRRLIESFDRKEQLMGAKGFFGGRSGPPSFKESWHTWLREWVAAFKDSGIADYKAAEIPEQYEQAGHRHFHVWNSHELHAAMQGVGLKAEIQEPRHHGGRVYRDCRVVGVKP